MARRRKSKLRFKSSWSVIRRGLTSASKSTLIRIIKILWSSSSRTAKNKVRKIVSRTFHISIRRKSHRRSRKSTRTIRHRRANRIRHRKSKPARLVKGSKAAKLYMAKIRRMRK